MKAWEVFGRISVNKSEAVSDLKSVEKQAKLSGGKMEKTLDKVGKAMKKAIVAGAVIAAAAVTAFAVSSIKKFADFENKMNEVFTLLPGITEEAMGAMSDDVKALSEEMGLLPDEIIPALYQAISAGIPQENVFDFMKIASQAAIGGVTTLEVAVDGLTSVVNAYGSSVITAQEAADIMFTAVRLGKTDFNQLSASLFQVNPIAAALGVSFEDVAAAMAEITAQGVPTSIAATQLRAMFVELSKASSTVAQSFAEITGTSFKEFIAEGHNVNDALQLLSKYANENDIQMQDMFTSVEAGSAVLALTGSHTESFTAKIDEMGNVAGATEGAYERMEKGMKRVFDRIKVWWNLLKIDVGEKLQEPIERLTEYLEDHQDDIADFVLNTFDKLVEGFEWIMDHSHEVAIGIEVIAAAFTALVVIKAAIWINGVTIALKAFAATNPVVLAAIAGLAGLYGIFKGGEAIYQGAADGVGQLTEKMQNLKDQLNPLGTAFNDTAGAAQTMKDKYDDMISSLDAGQTIIGLSDDKLGALKDEIARIYGVMEDAPDTETALRVWNKLIDELMVSWGDDFPKLKLLMNDSGKEAGEAVADGVTEGVGTVWDEQVLAARAAMKLIADAAKAKDGNEPPTVPLPDWSKLIALESKAAAAIDRVTAASVAGMTGSIEYKESIDELNSVYEEMLGLQDDGVTGLENYIDKLEDAGATTETVAEDMETALDKARIKVTEGFNAAGINIKASLSGIVSSLAEMYKANEQAQKDYSASVKKILTDDDTDRDTRKKTLTKTMSDIEELYRSGAITFEEMTTRKQKAQAEFNEDQKKADGLRSTELTAAKARYEEEKRSWSDVLADMAGAFLSYLKEQLLLKAAVAFAEAVAYALTLAWPMAAMSTAAGVALTGAAGALAIGGYEEGALAKGPTVGVIGEGQYDEAVLPLSPKVYQDLGRGIVEANEETEAGGSVNNVDMADMFNGAIFNVRSDSDVEEIARQAYDLFKERTRGAGGALG